MRSTILAARLALCIAIPGAAVHCTAVLSTAVFGLAIMSGPADARDRVSKSPHTNIQQSAPVSRAAASANARASAPRGGDGRFERQCVIMECGTPWCFNVRIN